MVKKHFSLLFLLTLQGVPSAREPGWVDYVWAGGNLAEAAGQLDKMEEHPSSTLATQVHEQMGHPVLLTHFRSHSPNMGTS